MAKNVSGRQRRSTRPAQVVPGMNTLLAIIFVVLVSLPIHAADLAPGEWTPQSSVLEENIARDWIQLTNGEWLNGEIISLRKERLMFDSDKFDRINLDWEDIRELHSAGELILVMEDNVTLTGQVSISGDVLMVRGMDGVMNRSAIISIIPSGTSWWANWYGALTVGFGLTMGNSEQLDLSVIWDAAYRTALWRYNLGYSGNVSVVSGDLVTSNQRASVSWDVFLGKRLYLTPISYSFYHNPFQNTQQQHTVDTGVGFMVIDRSRIDWNLFAGLGYQYLQYDSVQVGESLDLNDLVITFGSAMDADITSDIDFSLSLSSKVNMLNTVNYTHILASGIGIDLTRNLEIVTSLQWSYTSNPQVREDGSIPKKNDLDINAGISFNY